MNSVAVIGAGAWGTALAIQAARAGNAVTLWARDPARAEAILASRENPRLPGIRLPEPILATSAMPETADAALLAVPTQHLRRVLGRLPIGLAPLVVCAKGVEQTTLRLPLEIAADVRPGTPSAILTGPNFAHEIAAGLPAAAVVAASDAGLRTSIAALLGTPSFRLYGNDDPIGAQVGGAAKNVIAIAAGAVTGAGLGENARAALITRGLAELSRLAVALGGRAETVMGLSGLGDLLLTCTGPASRNYSLGLSLGRGEQLADVLAARSAVTEGVTTAPALVARAAAPGSTPGASVDLPICAAVASLLAGHTSLAEAITALLARPRRDE
jgi:glycerol-3-phosphate dehydrogenase (NAD(P)+)